MLRLIAIKQTRANEIISYPNIFMNSFYFNT